MRSNTFVDRDLGELGQDHFKAWCSQNGLSATKSTPDRLGWDYFVEFEPEINDAVPLDQHRDLKKMLVQVKATNKPSNSVRAKLSALKRLVDADLPAFMVHLDYSDQDTPRIARLLHIGTTQIHTILKRVRRAEKDGRFDLHNITLSLQLTEAEVIVENGTNLRTLLIRPIPINTAEYVEVKANFRRSCGYDENSIKAHFRLAPGQGSEALVDLLIGKVPELKLSAAEVEKQRFGITLDKDIDRLTEGILKVDIKPLQRAKLIVSSGASNFKRVEMDVDVYSPGMSALSRKHQKLRLVNEYIEIILHFGKKRAQMEFQINPEVRHPIELITNALAFRVALSENQATLEVDFGASCIQRLNAPEEAKAFSGWKLLHDFSDRLCIALFRHRRGARYETTVRELERILDTNQNMFALLSRPGLEVTVGIDDSLPSLPDNGAFLVPICIDFEPYIYIAIVRAEFDRLQRTDDMIRVVGLAPQIVEDQVLDLKQFRAVDINERVSQISLVESNDKRWIISTTLDEEDLTEHL